MKLVLLIVAVALVSYHAGQRHAHAAGLRCITTCESDDEKTVDCPGLCLGDEP